MAPKKPTSHLRWRDAGTGKFLTLRLREASSTVRREAMIFRSSSWRLRATLILTPIFVALAVPAQTPRGSSRNVLSAFLAALHTHDMERAQELSIAESAPLLLGYKVVAWRSVKSREIDLALLIKTLTEPASELRTFEEKLEAEKNRIKPEVEQIHNELRQVAKENDKLWELRKWGKISDEEYIPAREKLAAKRNELQRLLYELREPIRALDGKVSEIREETLTTAPQLRALIAHYALLLAQAFSVKDIQSINANAISKFRIQSREAIVDLQIQSRGGFRLFKKHSIILERPIVAGRRGRWLVTELNDLSE